MRKLVRKPVKRIQLTPKAFLKRIQDFVDEYKDEYSILISNDEYIYVILKKKIAAYRIHNTHPYNKLEERLPAQDYYVITRVVLEKSNKEDNIPELVIKDELYLEEDLQTIGQDDKPWTPISRC